MFASISRFSFTRIARQLSLAVLMAGAASLAAAAPVADTYHVEIDTSQFSGAGFLDFSFIAGNANAPGASAILSNFSGALGSLASQEGQVSGALPGSVTFGNGGFYNDLFHNIVLGGKFAFDLQFDASFLDSAGDAGTTFGIGLLDNNGYLGNASGNLLQFELTPLNGGVPASINANSFSNIVLVSAVPEPSTWLMLLGGIALIGVHLRRRQLPART
ncbi:NF038129 family PEP-CTERM protein [Janthinobacterium agaricidamnosum]|uniref:PEP-CTERM putative exosortase interaction domain protein n=1 Tax=Janthinobacterium agaricidamnosum NBRC 102515 = DSM 9628 TaxID=1349767 RepID=W0V6Y5_9BURK|nr:NF038129 family PEP-CTERM protein [Janthinobacterium agaricidamnosum]CDG84589.1 PEP-CTERM putative exosortase interaction domain protein [Janthinobacterium agaricidamnosum NBRC 102515 = DSM 9628]